MKNQQTRTVRGLKIALFFVALTTLVTMLCFFAVPVNADKTQVTVTEANLDLASIGITKDATGANVMQYVGKDALENLTLEMKSKPAGLSPTVSVVVKSVSFAKHNVGPTTMTVDFELVGDTAGTYITPHKLVIGVNIVPKELTWSDSVHVSATYDRSTTYYKFDDVTLPELVGVVSGDRVVASALIEVNADGAGNYQTQAAATLSNRNYTVAPLNVNATIEKVNIQYIDWQTDYTFGFGSNAAGQIKVYGYDTPDASGNEYPLTVIYPEGYGSVGTHEISVASPDAQNIKLDASLQTSRQVVITAKKYQVSMGNATFFGSSADDVVKYGLPVECAELPADIREKITYTVNGQPFTGTVAVGSYTVVATLPVSDNYIFVDAQGNKVETLQATLTVQNPYVAGGYDDAYQIIVVGNASNTGDVKVEVAKPSLARKAIRGFSFYKGYTVTLSGVNAGDRFTVLIPIDSAVRHKYAASVTAEDLYVYDAANGKMVKATESGYAVSVVDNAYIQIENYSAAGSVTFVVAPDASIPFFVTPIGIALLIILLIALLVLLFFIGLRLRRIRKDESVLVVVDPEGTPEENVADASESTEDEEQYLNDSVDAMVEQLNDEVAPEEEPEADVTEETEEAVREAIDELKAEAADEVLDVEEPVEEEVVEEPVEETLTEELADTVADQLEETVEADESTEVEEDEVQEAVNEALQEALNDSADATDAMELVEEPVEEEVAEEPAEEETVEVLAPVESEDAEESDDDDDDDDDDNGEVDTSFFGLNALDLNFIDVKADPDGYAELLERERNGEIRIITRYRRSFQSRMIQSTGNVQDYYNIIKNLLLSYKGVKNRVSWNYEAFNRGRVHVAKVNAKTKTLYLYLALDPEELADTKYGIVDVSSKKKYASVPVLMKIKGERKFKYALELIEKACGEVLELPKVKDFAETDYHMPYMTIDEMVEEGVLKKLCAGVPVEYFNTPAEDEVAPAEEKNAEVTAVPVTENAAELTPIEETPAEETPVEDVPATEETDETSTEV